MSEIINLGRDIEVFGKSGATYHGKIFDKETHTTMTGPAIVCLTNSQFYNSQWHHQVNAVYKTEKAEQAFEDFKRRDDISHLILIPAMQDLSRSDKVADLVHYYIHK